MRNEEFVKGERILKSILTGGLKRSAKLCASFPILCIPGSGIYFFILPSLAVFLPLSAHCARFGGTDGTSARFVDMSVQVQLCVEHQFGAADRLSGAGLPAGEGQLQDAPQGRPCGSGRVCHSSGRLGGLGMGEAGPHARGAGMVTPKRHEACLCAYRQYFAGHLPV